jgi:hypothetical protein
MFKTTKAIFPCSILLLSSLMMTFILFPSLSVKKTFDFDFLWSSLLIIFTFNVGDTVGKIICDFNDTFNEFSYIYVFFCRFFFFLTIPIMANEVSKQDLLMNNIFFPFLNQFLFGMTNGIIISKICLI